MAVTVRSAATYASAATEAATSGLVLPSGWQPGDVIYIGCELTAATGSITTPAGWTAVVAQFVSAVGGTPTSGHAAVFRRVMQPGDTDPVISFTSGRFAAAMVAVQGADNGTPEDVTPVTDDNTGVTAPSVRAPSITPVTAGCLLLTFHAVRNLTSGVLTSFTPDASETEQADAGTGVAAVSEAAAEAASLALADTSATGTKTATATGSNVTSLNMMGAAVAVRPAAAGSAAYAQPGQAWLRRFRHRQFLPPPVAAAAAAAVQPVNAPLRMAVPRLRTAPRSQFIPGARVPPAAVRPVRAPAAQLRRRPAGRVTAGMLPGTGLSGIPPFSHIRPRQARLVPLLARNRIVRGEPGSLTRPVPVPVVPRLRLRIRPVPSRLTAGILPPAAVQPVMAQQAVIRAAARRLARAPAQRLRTGMTPVTAPAPVIRAAVLAGARRAPSPPRARLARGITVPAAAVPVTARILQGRAGARPPAGRQRLTGPAFVPPPPHVSVPPVVLRWRSPAARRGRLTWPLQAPPPPPPFTVGALTSATAATAAVAAAEAATNALTASTALSSTIAAGTQRTGGPS